MPSSTTSTNTEAACRSSARDVTALRARNAVATLFGLCLLSIAAQGASPNEEREQLIAYFTDRFAGVPLDEYVYGALIANPGGREQYDQIMEFPPFLGDIEQGRKIWETPFRNGRTFADCFAERGRNVVGRYPYYDEKLGRVITFENALNTCL